MEVRRLSRSDGAVKIGVSSVFSGTGGQAAGGFRDQLGGRMKEDYRHRAQAVLEELESLGSALFERMDLQMFERYLAQLRDLLSEIVRNAYLLSTEDVLDARGRRRILSAVEVVDEKLGALALGALASNCDRLDYLSRVDEIRGLVMDILL